MTATNAELEAGLGTLLAEVQYRRVRLKGLIDPSAGAGLAAPMGVEYDQYTAGYAALSKTWRKTTAANTGWVDVTAGGGGGGGGTAADTTFDDAGTPITAANVQVAIVETLKRTGVYGTWDMTESLQDATPAPGGHLEAAVVEVDADNFNVTVVNGSSTAKVVQSRSYVPTTNASQNYSRFQRIAAGGDVGAVFFGYVNQEATMADVAQTLGSGPTGTCTAFALIVHDLVGFLGTPGDFAYFRGNGSSNPPTALGSLPASSNLYLSAYDNGFLTLILEDDPGVSSIGAIPQLDSAGVSGWKLVYGLYCLSASPSVPQQPVSIDFGDSTNGKSPVQISAPTLPSGAAEGRRFYVTAPGSYEGKQAEAKAVAEFYNGVSEIIVTPAVVLTQAQVEAVAGIAAQAIVDATDLDKGLPILDWTSVSNSTDNVYPGDYFLRNALIDVPYPINNFQLSAANQSLVYNGTISAVAGGNYPSWRYEGTASAQYCTIKWIDTIQAGITFANGGCLAGDVLHPTHAASTSAEEVLLVSVDGTGAVTATLVRNKVVIETIPIATGLVNDDIVSAGLSSSGGTITLNVKINSGSVSQYVTQMRAPEDGIRAWVGMAKASGTLSEQMFFRLGVDGGGALGSPLAHFTGQYSAPPANLFDAGFRYRFDGPGPAYMGHYRLRRGDIIECTSESPGTTPWVQMSRRFTVTRAKPPETIAAQTFDARSAALLAATRLEAVIRGGRIHKVASAPTLSAYSHGFGYTYLVCGTPSGAFASFAAGSLATSDGTSWVNTPAASVEGFVYTYMESVGTSPNYFQYTLRYAASSHVTYQLDPTGSFAVGDSTEGTLRTLGWVVTGPEGASVISSQRVTATGGGSQSIDVSIAQEIDVVIDSDTTLSFIYNVLASTPTLGVFVRIINQNVTTREVVTPAGTFKLQYTQSILLAGVVNNTVDGGYIFWEVFGRGLPGIDTVTSVGEGASINALSNSSITHLNITSALTAITVSPPACALRSDRWVLAVAGGGSVGTLTLNGQASLASPVTWPTALASGDSMEFLAIDHSNWIRIR